MSGTETFAGRVLRLFKKVDYKGALPEGIAIMNPYKDKRVMVCVKAFYNKYYGDNNRRRLILGINPGRLGAGATGIPFTDPKRLIEKCGIPYAGKLLHEPSSVYVYEMIEAYGGAEAFYADYYISSVCPLGFVKMDRQGKATNYNYFDSKGLIGMLRDFIDWNIKEQIKIGCDTDKVFCLGYSKNYQFLSQLNKENKYFGEIVPLEHPRFIVQYKSKEKDRYIADYLKKLA
ncbi:MAG: DUF4918 family protein [Bacteroidetes bacterium]|nr:DUF4918 family protein [Bacteroidota bacterium]